MSSGFEQGMIEVVRHASTIASIQKKANSVTNRRILFDWLKEKNKTEKELVSLSLDARKSVFVQHKLTCTSTEDG